MLETFDKLPIEAGKIARLKQFATQYRRHAGIHIRVEAFTGPLVVASVSQASGQLSDADLVERVLDLFKGEIPEYHQVSVAVTHDGDKHVLTHDDEFLLGLKEPPFIAKVFSAYNPETGTTAVLAFDGTNPTPLRIEQATKWVKHELIQRHQQARKTHADH